MSGDVDPAFYSACRWALKCRAGGDVCGGGYIQALSRSLFNARGVVGGEGVNV
jgi:hypothetical protein